MFPTHANGQSRCNYTRFSGSVELTFIADSSHFSSAMMAVSVWSVIPVLP